ncbi:MAG: hypothetical protein ACI92I_000457 [Acidimicrobiales bacterium]|jgi:hypothetical protein
MNKINLKQVILIACGIILGSLFCFFYVDFKNDSYSATTFVSTGDKDKDVTYWQAIIEKEGGFQAYKLFGEMYSGYDYNEQHDFVHRFGEALYKTEGVPGVAVCDSNYGFGCYHSFFGWALIDNGLDILTELDKSCIETYGEKGLGCQHGIGHGVLAEIGSDNLNDALEACTVLNWKGPIGGCTSGVFMEYNFTTMVGGGTRDPEKSEAHYPCTALDKKFQLSCYFEQPAWWIAHTQHDYMYTGSKCAAIETKLNREACYKGVGNTVAGSAGYSIKGIQKACSKMPNAEGEILCIEGAAWITSAQPEFDDVWMDLCTPFTGVYYQRCVDSRDFI